MSHPFAARNNLSVKFALLVAAIFAIALAALLLMQRAQRKSLADLLEAETRERVGMMRRVVELTGQALRDFTYDYAQWDDMVTFVAEPRREWAAINIDASLKNFHLAAVWVLRVDGTVVYATRGEDPQRTAPVLPVDAAELSRVLAAAKATSFFVRRADELLELCFSPVRPSSDTERVTAPLGWLVAARRWDVAQLGLIAEVMQCETELVPPERAFSAAQADRVSLDYPLRGADGAVAANLRYTFTSQELRIVGENQRAIFIWLAGTFLLTAIVVVTVVFRWIVRPVKIVGESLHARDARPILPLLERHDEVGRVAHAVKTSFDQHAALEAMIAERTRLGRELHDGLIQTVFAAGMSLAGARASLRQNPAEAERILDSTRTELNATIRSLRDFIDGLEAEPDEQWPFGEAVRSIVTLMQGVRPVRSTLRIDEKLGATLSSRERLHLLQITREAVSNTVRHGQAQHLLVRFERDGGDVVLEISDDGIGLERTPSLDGGHGLTNFAARAKELGGDLQVTSAPGGGLRVTLTFPKA